jgi:hypothetical protein
VSPWYALNPQCYGIQSLTGPEIVYLNTWGSPGPNFSIYSFVALNANQFYEAKVDHDNNNLVSLQLRDRASGVLWSVNSGINFTPTVIAKDYSGNIYWAVMRSLFKVSASGQILWRYDDNDPIGGFYYQYLRPTPDGGVLVTSSSPGLAFEIKKFSSDGSMLWTTVARADALDVAKDGFGGFYVASTDPFGRAGVYRYDDNGSVVWSLVGKGVFGFDGVTVDSVGNFYVVYSGDDLVTGTNHGFYVVRYDPSGRLLWILQMPSDVYFSKLIWQNGYLYGGSGDPYSNAVVKISTSGVLLWTTRVPASYQIGLDSSDDIFISGHQFFSQIGNR